MKIGPTWTALFVHEGGPGQTPVQASGNVRLQLSLAGTYTWRLSLERLLAPPVSLLALDWSLSPTSLSFLHGDPHFEAFCALPS